MSIASFDQKCRSVVFIKTRDVARDVTSCISQKCRSQASIRIVQKCRSAVLLRSVAQKCRVAQKCYLKCRSAVSIRSVAQKSCSEVSHLSDKCGIAQNQKCRSDVLIRSLLRSVAQKCRSAGRVSHRSEVPSRRVDPRCC